MIVEENSYLTPDVNVSVFVQQGPDNLNVTSSHCSNQHRLSALEEVAKDKQRWTWSTFHLHLKERAAGKITVTRSHPVWDVDVGPCVQKVLDNLCVSLLGCNRQGRVSVLVRHVDIWVPLQQLFDNFCEASFHSHDQSGHWILEEKKKGVSQSFQSRIRCNEFHNSL